jgi:hypothetical protein
MEKRICGLHVKNVQCDELWGYVGMKEKTKKRQGKDDDAIGDAWTFVAIERQAIFGGRDRTGGLKLYWIKITFDGNRTPPIQPEGQVLSPEAVGGFTAFGFAAIPLEFLKQQTARAKIEAKTWKPPKGSNPSDYDILKVIRLIQLAIQYDKSGAIGGKIDAVQLNRNGTLNWFARKDYCPAN